MLEAVLATALIGGVAAGVAVMVQRFARSDRESDARIVADRLAQDRIEELRALPFLLLPLTAEEDAPDQGCRAGARAFDRNPDQLPPETITRETFTFYRMTCVEMVKPDDKGAYQTLRSGPSSGLKRLWVTVQWSAHPLKPEQLGQGGSRTRAETIIHDPSGPAIAMAGEGEARIKVVCEDAGQIGDCGGIPVRVLTSTGAFIASGVSQRDGSWSVNGLPPGTLFFQPVVMPGDLASPDRMTAQIDPGADHPVDVGLLTIRRQSAFVKVASNRTRVLIVASKDPWTDEMPPAVELLKGRDRVFSRQLPGDATFRVPPAQYAFGCWSRDGLDRWRRVIPPGGESILLRSGDLRELTCAF